MFMKVTILSDMYQEFDGVTYKFQGRYFEKAGRRLHREVWKYHNGAIPHGYHIHHIDHDKTNNQIDNLECVSASKHLSQHWTDEKKVWASKNVVEKAMPAAKEWHKTEDGRVWHRKHAVEMWKHIPTYKMNCTICGNEYKTRRPAISKYCGDVCRARAFRARHSKA